MPHDATRYDATRYDPPAPVARVGLRATENDAVIRDVPLLIDTGADITLLPRSAVARLGVAVQPARYEVIAFDGVRSSADAVDLDMLFLGKAFRGRYLLTEGDHGILGRDVLESLKLILDGPAQQWTKLDG